MKFRSIPDMIRSESMNSAELRSSYLLDDLFQPGKFSAVYLDNERTIIGGAVASDQPLQLGNPEMLRADYFCQRREMAVMNIGGSGSVTVDGSSYAMQFRDALYIGRGAKEVAFQSDVADTPARFYLVSYPAHQQYPTRHGSIADAEPLHLGSKEAANERTIFKYIFKGGIESCQLVMGFTEMAPGSVWNTMPAHKHLRRSEVYLYFNLDDDAAVFHFMGRPQETRHLLVRNEQAVFSPPWSIHAGSGTKNYSFIWAMGGENRDYTDMDAVSIDDLR